jgi:4a-hydroxytetrahydrobiopterin dehydratase
MSPSNRKTDDLCELSEVRNRLFRELPQWELCDNALWREYKTSGWKSTLMLVGLVGHLSEVAWHHPDLSVSYDKVGIRVTNHDAGGVTDKDFALAIKINEVLDWDPATEAGCPLEGIPSDSRFKYLDLSE